MQTLTVREAETQLQSLVKQAQTTHQPVLLTNDGATPVAVLTPLSDEQPSIKAALLRRLEILESVMQMWQQHWRDPAISQDAVQLLQSQLRQLGTSAGDHPPALGALVMLLRLAARQMTTPTMQQQVQAFAFGVDLLRAKELSWLHVEKVDGLLLASGIDTRATFDGEELLQSYVDAR